ncbi:MAG: EI24 domain-containing protein [Enhygromyxa sp.]
MSERLPEPAPEPEPEPEPRSVTAPQPTVPSLLGPVSEQEPALDPESKPEPELPSLEELDAEARRHFTILLEHAREPTPVPRSRAPLDEFVWGLAQPLLGLRVLIGHGDLFVRGLIPAALFIVVCSLLVIGSEAQGLWESVVASYGILVGAASISPILFCRNYAKLAAEARRHLDLSRHDPYLRSYGQAIAETITQAILLGVGVAPWAALIGGMPLFGWIWAAVIGWLWVLHWIIVEALDSARTLGPDDDPETFEQLHQTLAPPWYAATLFARLEPPLPTLLAPVRWWGGVMARLGRRWRGEVALIEARPWLAAGFGLGASLLLMVPVLNLLFRPAVVVAASHVLGRVELEDQDQDRDQGETP